MKINYALEITAKNNMNKSYNVQTHVQTTFHDLYGTKPLKTR